MRSSKANSNRDSGAKVNPQSVTIYIEAGANVRARIMLGTASSSSPKIDNGISNSIFIFIVSYETKCLEAMKHISIIDCQNYTSSHYLMRAPTITPN